MDNGMSKDRQKNWEEKGTLKSTMRYTTDTPAK